MWFWILFLGYFLLFHQEGRKIGKALLGGLREVIHSTKHAQAGEPPRAGSHRHMEEPTCYRPDTNARCQTTKLGKVKYDRHGVAKPFAGE